MTSIYRNNFFFLSDGQNSFGNQMTAILVFHASFSISSNINTSISLPLPPSPLVFQLLEKKQFVILSWRGYNFSFLRNSPTFTHLFFLLERCKGGPFHKCDPGSKKTKTLDANRGQLRTNNQLWIQTSIWILSETPYEFLIWSNSHTVPKNTLNFLWKGVDSRQSR